MNLTYLYGSKAMKYDTTTVNPNKNAVPSWPRLGEGQQDSFVFLERSLIRRVRREELAQRDKLLSLEDTDAWSLSWERGGTTRPRRRLVSRLLRRALLRLSYSKEELENHPPRLRAQSALGVWFILPFVPGWLVVAVVTLSRYRGRQPRQRRRSLVQRRDI